MVILSWFYIVKTVNKMSPLEWNEHNMVEFCSNNLVPHVHDLYLNVGTKWTRNQAWNPLTDPPSMASWSFKYIIVMDLIMVAMCKRWAWLAKVDPSADNPFSTKWVQIWCGVRTHTPHQGGWSHLHRGGRPTTALPPLLSCHHQFKVGLIQGRRMEAHGSMGPLGHFLSTINR
jgi:hypothetical protein